MSGKSSYISIECWHWQGYGSVKSLKNLYPVAIKMGLFIKDNIGIYSKTLKIVASQLAVLEKCRLLFIIHSSFKWRLSNTLQNRGSQSPYMGDLKALQLADSGSALVSVKISHLQGFTVALPESPWQLLFSNPAHIIFSVTSLGL